MNDGTGVTPPDLAAGPDVLAELADATEQLLAAARTLADASAAGPSGLPGWTRGHVLTHVARNADGMARVADGAIAGRQVRMYDSHEVRDAAIEDGAGRPAEQLVADVQRSAASVARAFAGLAAVPADLEVPFGPADARTAVGDLPLLRIREVRIHAVDLDAGLTCADWPAAFVARTLAQLAPRFLADPATPVARLVDHASARSWGVGTAGPDLTGDPVDLLAWLVGRPYGDSLALAGGGPLPDAPRWL